MNIQTEHLDNHTARLTVEVEPERVEKAMQIAARRISARTNIPGFRKGKAPYKIVMRYIGAQGLLEESIEDLGDSVYQEALDQSGIKPYTAGRLENIEPGNLDTNPTLKLIFTVPEMPDVDLGAYRDVRLPFETPDVEDETVTKTIKRIQEQRALVEPATRPAQMGDKVKLELSGTLVHRHGDDHVHEDEHEHEHTEGEAASESAESAEAETHEAHETHEAYEAHEPHEHTDEITKDEIELVLKTDDDMVPGFSENIVGLSAGETKEFTLEFPTDYEKSDFAGHTYNFKVEIKEVQSVTLPVLNDDFAKQATDNEIDNLLDYRIKVRKDLQDAATRRAENDYADAALDKLVEGATLKYSDVMVEEYMDDIMQELEQSFKERGISLSDFMKVEGRDKESLRASYRDTATRRLERSLVLGKLVDQENITVSEAEVDAEIDRMAQQFGEQANVFKQMLMQPQTRRNILMDIVKNHALERLIAIARGENPPIQPMSEVAAQASEQATQPPAEEMAAPTSEATNEQAATEPTSEQAEAKTE